MTALPRPDLPPGPARTLNDALHDLHHRAGWPSLRTLARETGVSHTTVSKIFSSSAPPPWGTVELVVEAMAGDCDLFRELWLAATSPTNGDASTVTPGIAGRRAELDVVRRHLETGSGLLLVTGEAGIGKTTLVTTAAKSTSARTAVGNCLPLSGEIPLLPIADCIRSVREQDVQAFSQVLTDCPSYVSRPLSTLVPEVGTVTSGATRAEDRGLLFSALAAVLRACADRGRLALLLEDLHWSDPATLDFVEHLISRSLPIAVIGTWRSDDPATPHTSDEWRARVSRLPATTILTLGPLSREETAEQLALLGTDALTRLDAIHAKSQGLPLFTEQLAAHLDEGPGLPSLLAELLDRRLLGLQEAAWSVVRALGVAERPLAPAPLAAASSLVEAELTPVLRELSARRILCTNEEGQVQLQHPLLAEAVQRRLVAGESVRTHRALAQALGEQPEPEAAEVAEHWCRAGDPDEELDWRIAAARAAAARFDRRQEADHWLRVLQTWPTGCTSRGDPPARRADAYVCAMDALRASFRFSEAAALSEAAEATLTDADTDEGERADLLFRRSIFRGEPESFESGLALLDEAIAIHDRLPVREGKVRALDRKQNLLFAMGRPAESRAVAHQEVDAARELGDPILLRDALMRVAWHVAIGGDVEGGQALLARARVDAGVREDPIGDVKCGVYATDMLLNSGAPADEVVAAGRQALAVADAHGLDTPPVMLIRVNVAFALLRGGRVAEADEVVALPTGAEFEVDRWPLHTARAVVDSRRGLVAAAMSRLEQIWAEPSTSAARDLEFLVWATDVAWWAGAAEPALARVIAPLHDVAETASLRLLAPTLVAGARAAASLDDRDALARLADVARRSGLLGEEHRHDRTLVAHHAAFAAELAAPDSVDPIGRWSSVATSWDGLGARHDAAYSRWRAAQCALRERRGTVAARLLRKAAADALEHVPLSRAIAATVATDH